MIEEKGEEGERERERDEETARGGRKSGVECEGKNKLVKESERQKAKI